MKVRLTQNSVRIRLSQSEVRTLGENGTLSMAVGLVPQPLEVRIDGAATGPVATFQGSTLTVHLPASRVRAWADSEETGISDESNGVRVLVEKDFECLHPADPSENQDTFPNPAR